MNAHVQAFLFVVVHLLLLVACSSKEITLEEEAEAFCQIHEKEHWQAIGGETAENGFKLIAAETRRVVKSEAFMGVFEKLAKEGYDDYYQALQVEISEMLGEPWHCEAAKRFYTIQWKRVGEKEYKSEVVVEVLPEGALVIGASEFEATDLEKIRKALQDASNGESYRLMVKLPEGASEDDLNKYLEPFYALEIEELSVLME